jgi:hypothetical protein
MWAGSASASQGGLEKYVCQACGIGRASAVVERWAEYCVFHWWKPNGAMDAALEAEARARDGEDGANLLADNRADRALLERLEDKLADELLAEAAYKRQRRRIEDRIAARDEIIRKRQRRSELDGIPERGEQLRARWRAEGLPFQWRLLAVTVAKVVIQQVGKGNRPFDPRSIEVIPGGALGCLEPGDPVLTVPAPGEGMRRGREPTRRIRAWLGANPDAEFTPRSLAAGLGMPLASVRAIVTRMRKDGEIIRVRAVRGYGPDGGRGSEEARYKAAGER